MRLAAVGHWMKINRDPTKMRRVKFLILLLPILIGLNLRLPVQSQSSTGNIYHGAWIDLNKNGRMDVYEDAKAEIDLRISDLLSQMNLEEKT